MSLIRLPAVQDLPKLSRTRLLRYEASEPPMFPRRSQLGERAVAWDRAEVEAWLTSRETLTVNCKDAPHRDAAVQP